MTVALVPLALRYLECSGAGAIFQVHFKQVVKHSFIAAVFQLSVKRAKVGFIFHAIPAYIKCCKAP